MATKASWSGPIRFGLINLPVKAYPALGSSPKAEVTRAVCECCNEPFSSTLACPAGNTKWSKAAEERGESNLTRPIPAVQDGDGWLPLDPDAYAEINELGRTDAISVEPVPADEVPFYLSTGSLVLQPDGKGNDGVYSVMRDALAESGLVLVGEWAAKTVPQPVVIYDMGDVLMMNTLPYAAQLRDVSGPPAAYAPQELDMAVKVLLAQAAEFDYSRFGDSPVVVERSKLIEEARRNGGVVTKRSPSKPTEQVAPGGLAALLEAQLKAA